MHVDASAASLNAVYPAAARPRCCAPGFLRHARGAVRRAHRAWTRQGIASWRGRIGAADRQPEPLIAGLTPQEFFATLRRKLPDAALLVTDSGLHQVMARRYFEVRQPYRAAPAHGPAVDGLWHCRRPLRPGWPPRSAPWWR